MKKWFLFPMCGVLLLGAGCRPSTQDVSVQEENAPAHEVPLQKEIAGDRIENNAFMLALDANVAFEESMNGGRYQNYVPQSGPQTLGEGEYFIEFTTRNTIADLEFVSMHKGTTPITFGGQVLDRGELKDEFHGGDTTRYIVGYFRPGNGDALEPVMFSIYADTKSGLAAGEATLSAIQWKN